MAHGTDSTGLTELVTHPHAVSDNPHACPVPALAVSAPRLLAPAPAPGLLYSACRRETHKLVLRTGTSISTS